MSKTLNACKSFFGKSLLKMINIGADNRLTPIHCAFIICLFALFANSWPTLLSMQVIVWLYGD